MALTQQLNPPGHHGHGGWSEEAQFVVELQARFESSSTRERAAVLDALLQACGAEELDFLKRVVSRRTPLSSDPVAALGRQLAVKILSFLDPRSLSRCARVSWGWHDVAVLDRVWKPKCISRGWPLPYAPSPFETGAWRSWYIQCVAKIEAMAADAQRQAENSIEAAVDAIKQARLAEQRALDRAATDSSRRRGGDDGDDDDGGLSSADEAPDSIGDGYDDDTIAPEHRVLRRHTRECELRLLSLLQQQGLEQYAPFILAGAEARGAGRSGGGRAARGGSGGGDADNSAAEAAFREFQDRTAGRRTEVSRALEAIEALMKRRVAEAKKIHQRKPAVRTVRPDDSDADGGSVGGSGGDARGKLRVLDPLPGSTRGPATIIDDRLPGSFDSDARNDEGEVGELPEGVADDRYPRVVLVSSACRARSLLLNAVRFDVASVPYDAAATTADALLRRVARLLRGRKARSVALVCPGGPGVVSVCSDLTVTLRALVSAEGRDDDDFAPSISPINFWRRLSRHLLPADRGGAVHVFAGEVTDSVAGAELVEAVREVVGVPVTCPRPPLGKTGRYTWCWGDLSLGAGTAATRLYFNDARLTAWVHAEAACSDVVADVRRSLAVALPQAWTAASAHLVGELAESVLFDPQWVGAAPTLLRDIEDAIAATLRDAPKDPALHLADFLRQRHAARRESSAASGDGAGAGASDPDADAGLWLPIDEQHRAALAQDTALVRSMTDFDTLVRGEEAFVAHLRAIDSVFAKPLRAMMQVSRQVPGGGSAGGARPLTTIAYRKVFTDALAVLKVHEQMLDKLHAIERTRDPNRGGGLCIAELAREERTYRSYVHGLSSTLRAIAECCDESPTFRAFLTQSRERCGGRSLLDLVQLPFQRLPLYVRVLDREIASGRASKAVVERLQQIRAVVSALAGNAAALGDKAALRRHAEAVIGSLPLKEGTHPPPADSFVIERRFVQCDLVVDVKRVGKSEPRGDGSGSGVAYVPLRDAALMLFRDEIVIVAELSYFDAAAADPAVHRALVGRFGLETVSIEPAEGSRDHPHVVRVECKHTTYYFAAPRRAGMLEFVEAVNAIEVSSARAERAKERRGVR